MAAVFRVIPYEILSFEALGLPAVVAEMARRPRVDFGHRTDRLG